LLDGVDDRSISFVLPSSTQPGLSPVRPRSVKYIGGGIPMEFLAGSLLELITRTSCDLPPDVRTAMSIAATAETPGTQSSQALDVILANIDMARSA
jgi:hypothetical protein